MVSAARLWSLPGALGRIAMQSELLSNQELRSLTGYHIRDSQCQELGC